MPCRFAVLAAAILLVGCSRYNTQTQGPFNRQPTPVNPALTQGTPPASKSSLVLNTPTNPLPPGPPDEAQPVPPRPPEPAPLGMAYNAPQPQRTTIRDSAVVPASGSFPAPSSGSTAQPYRSNPAPGPGAPSSPVAPPVASTQTPAPAVASTQDSNLQALKRIVQIATTTWKQVDTYEAKFVRRESIDGAQGKTEELQCQFRKEPMSIYMRNIGEVGKGREILYNPGQYGDKLHIVVGAGDSSLIGAGFKPAPMSPDDPRVKGKSRHSIRDSGFGTTIDRFGGLVARFESGKLPPGSLRYVGLVKRVEFGEFPLEAVEQTVRRGDEEGVPIGGLRRWYFDGKPGSPSYGLPILVILVDSKNRELEYYQFSQIRSPALLTNGDFDPARLGKK